MINLKDIEVSEEYEATYCPEDNKLRLYVGRVEREEYLFLKNNGFTSTPKQDCDFVAKWTTGREDICLHYASGIIGDEDTTPAERSIQRAERFEEYRGKRLSEACDHADNYESGDFVHGYQSEKKAEAALKKQNRQADRACEQWRKAEYWQRRTKGVIASALHRADAGVRMGRIKEIEKNIRKYDKELSGLIERATIAKNIFNDKEKKEDLKLATHYFGSYQFSYGNYKHPEHPEAPAMSLYDWCKNGDMKASIAWGLYIKALPDPENQDSGINRALNHNKLRLAYENQMLEGQGGMLEQLELEKGGRIGSYLIRKVNKSPATKRVTSVDIFAPMIKKGSEWEKRHNIEGTEFSKYQLKTERLEQDTYSPPTKQSLAELEEIEEAVKAVTKGKTISLINPTLEEARRLQKIWDDQEVENAKNSKYNNASANLGEVIETTQKRYSYLSGPDSHYSTVMLDAEGFETTKKAKAVCKIRRCYGSFARFSSHRVIHLTDKPAKALPIGIEPTKEIKEAQETQKESKPALTVATAKKIEQTEFGFDETKQFKQTEMFV